MFNFFKKKENTIKITDTIWMTQQAKWNGLAALWKKDQQIAIITWFEDSFHQLEKVLQNDALPLECLFLARSLNSHQLAGKKIIFSEHHPLFHKEQDHFRQWQLRHVHVHSALDEPLFQYFGGEKIIGMMKELGMSDEGMIEHSMISNAIRNAQQKIEKKVSTEFAATSQQQWIARNLPVSEK
ncbi:MAG: hypothetical protein H7Y42_16175 [Chitinophagaceae bacterium]|nr:hypothetical protein [Chitinophagaceae bacterium]